MFDIIVLGGGPGGYEAAEQCAKIGLRTVLIEKSNLGGTCLNEGCIPLKSFLNNSKIITEVKHLSKQGNVDGNVNGLQLNQNMVCENKNKVVGELAQGIEKKLLFYGVEIKKGYGRIQHISDEKVIVEVEDALGQKEVITSKKLIIATGSSELLLKQNEVTTYDITNYWCRRYWIGSSKLF